MEQLDLVQFYWHQYSNSGYVEAAKHLAELQVRPWLRWEGGTNRAGPGREP